LRFYGKAELYESGQLGGVTKSMIPKSCRLFG
jgi:hypothetical protein